MTMLPGKAFSAKEELFLVFIDEGDLGVQWICRFPLRSAGDYFRAVWNPDEQPNQWQAIADLIDDKKPSRIGINISSDVALADGLIIASIKLFTLCCLAKIRQSWYPLKG